MRPLPATKPLLSSLMVLLGAFLCADCNDPEINSLYSTGTQDLPSPTITSISPPGLALAGMDTVIVQGTNLSPDVNKDFLFFNGKKATLLTASATQLTAIAPLVVGDSVAVRVSVLGALAFSNTAIYSLAAAVVPFGDLLPATPVAPAEKAVSLATDTSGNLYVAYTYGVADAGILKFTPGGVRSRYAAATPGVAAWTNVRFGPSGYLYAVRNVFAIYRFAQGGGAAATVWRTAPGGTYIADIDFDQDGNMWAVGNNANIYRILQDKTLTAYPFVGNIRCARVFEGYLYFSANASGAEKVWRAQISAGGLGTPEVYFDLSAVMPTVTPKSLTFSTDRTLVIASSSDAGVLIVPPGGSASTPFQAFRSSFAAGLSVIAWGSSTNLYCATADGFLLRFMMRGRSSAPYYGSTL